MSAKQAIKPIFQFIKSIFILFVPFYWLKGISSKPYQLNTDNDSDLKNRRPDNYKRSDVNNEIRGWIRAFSILLAISFVTIGIAALTTPIFGWAIGVPLSIVIGIGIMPKIFDIIAKQVIRFISWINHRSDSTIINTTYPAKYKPYAWPPESDADPVIEQMHIEDNKSTYEIMKRLYLKKQDIKHNPEGWFGLSVKQQEHCDSINLAVKFFRNNACYNSWSYLNYPDNNPTKFERVYKRSVCTLNEKNGFTPSMQEFLHSEI
jgi:hypothetical protein